MTAPGPQAAPEFFHRIEGLCLTPGNKTAGFDALVSTEVLIRLSTTPADPQWQENLAATVRERVLNANLLARNLVEHSGIVLIAGTLCPRFFVTDPGLGGSVGADPNELERLGRDDALAWIGPSVAYTPHNVDTPAQALALLIMVETWAEVARSFLLSLDA